MSPGSLISLRQSGPADEFGEARIVAQRVESRIDFEYFKVGVTLFQSLIQFAERFVFFAERRKVYCDQIRRHHARAGYLLFCSHHSQKCGPAAPGKTLSYRC